MDTARMSLATRSWITVASCILSHGALASAQSAGTGAPVTPPIEVIAAPPPVAAMQAQPIVPPNAAPAGMVSFSSTGEPLQIALVPAWAIVPPDGFIQWACRTPCAVPVAAGDYHLVAHTPAARLIETIFVRPGANQFRITPRRSRGLGFALVGIGGGLAIFGVSFLLVGLQMNAYSGLGIYINATPYYAIGAVGLGVGIALLVPGILQVLGSRGRVDVVTGAGPSARRRGPRLLSAGVMPMADGAFGAIQFAF